MLYRLSISKQHDQFLFKGALQFDLWFDVPHRPTHDADFLDVGSAELPHIEALFREICQIQADDGIVFQPDTVKADEIRKEANYAGVRVTLVGLLNGARCPVQLDIGFGDAVVPGQMKPTTQAFSVKCPAPTCESRAVSQAHTRHPARRGICA